MNLPVIRTFSRAWTRFNEDGCFYRASAIAYAMVLSAVPLLTVLVRFVDKETIRAYISRFMGAYGIQDAAVFLRVLDEILDRTDTIAFVGIVIMILSAASVLRHIEDSFNHIARALHERPIHYRFALYISGIIIVPAFLTLSAGTLQFGLLQLKPPEYKSVTLNGETLWMLGKTLTWREKNKDGKFSLRSKIDMRAPYKDIYFDLTTGKIGKSWEVGVRQPRSIEGRDLRSLNRMDAADGVLYVLGETGTLFFSRDNGRTFDFRIFEFIVPSGQRNPIFEDMLALPDGRALILATVDSKSCLLEVKQTGYGMQCFNSVYNRVLTVKNGTKKEIFIAGTGRVLRSEDDGSTWLGPFEEKFGARSVRIEAMERDEKGRLYIAGGAIWIKDARATEYPTLRSPEQVHGVRLTGNGTGFLYGDGGLIRYTSDGGRIWHGVTNSILRNTTFYAHKVLSDDRTVLVGENATYVILGPPKMTSMTDDKGHTLVEFSILEEDHSSEVLTFLSRAMLWILFYGLLSAVITLAYRYIPTHPISTRSAIIGGWFTSTGLLAFVIGFQVWITGFSNTGQVYGVWAVVPVGMILLLVCTQILFFGLELACVIDENRTEVRSVEDAPVRLAQKLKVHTPLVPVSKKRHKK
ncbi:MAG: YihY/virulence factor BrkB family protein [Leptospirales bacterium]|nr:YihY/virulence factor BrkB family protein [Leptospirales bacterium]